MRLKFLVSTLALMLVLFAVAANAQEVKAPSSEAPKSEPVKVSGRMYLEWLKTLQNQNDAGENTNTFNLTRVYLDFRKKIDEMWSTRVTLDVGNDTPAATNKDSRYIAYIKYAYLQSSNDLGFGRLTMQFGMIGTPVIGLIDDSSDYRWLNQNYIDAAKLLLFKQSGVTGGIGQSIDSSADMGLSLALNVMNMVTITGAVTNGEGYKKTNELSFHDDGKAMYAMITVTPIEGLALAGFMRNEVTRDRGENSEDNFSRYYGGFATYNFQGIRVGASYVMATVSSNGTTPGTDALVAKYSLLDLFLMANLKSLTGMPVLVAGRYAMGTSEYSEGYGANDGVEAKTTIWAFGVGYQFNDNVRVMAYLEDQKAESSDAALAAAADWKASNRNFYIKTEARF